jgi:hypothetical protein
MPDPRLIASLGLLGGALQIAAIGLLARTPDTAANPLGYGRRPRPKRPHEDDEAFLIAALL